jgi:alpha/beta superfamily hydrolase
MKKWNELCNLIIRPERALYEPEDLGPTVFTVQRKRCQRTSLELKNDRGLIIRANHYQPANSGNKKLPCVIICHGNCGNQLNAISAVRLLLPHDITVMAMDFTGSGLSEGKYVSLGFYESQDIGVVVKYLREHDLTSTIGLWGRSMGAVASLMYSQTDPSVACMVLDSAFCDLKRLMRELIKSYAKRVPSLLAKAALAMMRSSIKSKAKFDFYTIKPAELAQVRSACVYGVFNLYCFLFDYSHMHIDMLYTYTSTYTYSDVVCTSHHCSFNS